jgi:hypothetical protein
MVPTPLVVNHQIEYSQLMEWKGMAEHEKMGRKKILYSLSIPSRILLLKVNVYTMRKNLNLHSLASTVF